MPSDRTAKQHHWDRRLLQMNRADNLLDGQTRLEKYKMPIELRQGRT